MSVGVDPEDGEVDEFEGGNVGGFEDDGGSHAGFMGFHPTVQAEAPVVAVGEPGEVPFRARRDEVIAPVPAEFQKFMGHDGADGVLSKILRVEDAIAAARKAGHGIGAAGEEGIAKYIRRHKGTLPPLAEISKNEY